MRKAIYPGTFDPVTLGHLDVIRRASKLFDHITIGVAMDTGKDSLFTLDERVALVEEQVEKMSNVIVKPFSGLLVNFASNEKCFVIIRGIRVVSDFEYEFQLSLMNKKLYPDLETVFLMTASEHLFISSTIIKQVSSLGGCVEGLVPPSVAKALHEKLKKR